MVATKQNDAAISELTEALNNLEDVGEEKGNLVLKKESDFSSDVDNNLEPDLGLFDDEEDDEEEEEKGRKFSSRAIVRFVFIFGLVSVGVISFVNVMLREKNNTANMNYGNENVDTAQLLAEQKKRSRAEIERLNERIAELENQSLLDKQTKLIKSQTEELERPPQVQQKTSPTVVSRPSPPPSPPPFLPPSPPPVIRETPPPQIDPSAISSKAAQTGHYTVGGNWDKPVNIIADTSNDRPNAPKETVQILDNKDKLLTWGTKATGELETQIGWEGSLSSIASKNFIIKLTSHLLSPNGKVVVPSGTKIITRIAGAKATGEIQLIAKYFQLQPTNGKVMLLPIPENTVLIQDRDRDGLLIASSIRKSTLGRDAIAAILGGTAKMTEIINRPESSSYNSWNGGSNSTVINGDGNVGAAFIGGAAEQLNSRMTRQNEAEIRRRINEPIVFVLPKNTEIEIYINENFYPLQGSKKKTK